MAAKGIQFPWRWGRGTISTKLDVIWEMSEQGETLATILLLEYHGDVKMHRSGP
jgi:hypothetical protein